MNINTYWFTKSMKIKKQNTLISTIIVIIIHMTIFMNMRKSFRAMKEMC